jgi:hemerythrin
MDATMPQRMPVEELPALVWLGAFETGNAKVDGEHRELLADMNDLSSGLTEGRGWSRIVGASKQLRDKCVAHFCNERKVLKESRYKKLAAHEKQHRYIEQQLDDVIAYIDAVDRPSRAEVEAILYLRSMLVHHFFRYDLAFKSHLLHAHTKTSPSRLRGTRAE